MYDDFRKYDTCRLVFESWIGEKSVGGRIFEWIPSEFCMQQQCSIYQAQSTEAASVTLVRTGESICL